jgi:sodium-dependent dicarboxylate transporter 2/3/5
MVTAVSSSFAYCLVIGTPPNAIVYASGYLEPKDFLRVGLPLWILSQVLLIVIVGVLWQVMGFGDLPGF